MNNPDNQDEEDYYLSEVDSVPNKNRRGFLAAGLGAGAALLGAINIAPFEDIASNKAVSNVAILQTAASIDNLAVKIYTQLSSLPFVTGSGANPVLSSFVTTTISQHQEHADSYNAAATSLKGKQQKSIDQVLYDSSFKGLLSKVSNPLDAISIAMSIEEIAAETFLVATETLTDPYVQKVASSIIGVEAQHLAFLKVMQNIINSNAALLSEPVQLALYPSSVGTAAFSSPVLNTTKARPLTEGALP